jgi:hypothetical protein
MAKRTLYEELINRPPRIEVDPNAREVVFYTISAMCDNKGHLRFKRTNGEFKLSGMGFAVSNWQIPKKEFELEWLADEGKWDEIRHAIDLGVTKVQKVISR